MLVGHIILIIPHQANIRHAIAQVLLRVQKVHQTIQVQEKLSMLKDITEKMEHMSDPIQEAVLVVVEDDTKYTKGETYSLPFCKIN